MFLLLLAASCEVRYSIWDPFELQDYYPNAQTGYQTTVFDTLLLIFSSPPAEGTLERCLSLMENGSVLPFTVKLDQTHSTIIPESPFDLNNSYEIVITTEAENIFGVNLLREIRFAFPDSNKLATAQPFELISPQEEERADTICLSTGTEPALEFSSPPDPESFLSSAYFTPAVSGSWHFDAGKTRYLLNGRESSGTDLTLHLDQSIRSIEGEELTKPAKIRYRLAGTLSPKLTGFKVISPGGTRDYAGDSTTVTGEEPPHQIELLFNIPPAPSSLYPALLTGEGYQIEPSTPGGFLFRLNQPAGSLSQAVTLMAGWESIDGIPAKEEVQIQLNWKSPRSSAFSIQRVFVLENPHAAIAASSELHHNRVSGDWCANYKEYAESRFYFFCSSQSGSPVDEQSLIEGIRFRSENNTLQMQKIAWETAPELISGLPSPGAGEIIFALRVRMKIISPSSSPFHIQSTPQLCNRSGEQADPFALVVILNA